MYVNWSIAVVVRDGNCSYRDSHLALCGSEREIIIVTIFQPSHYLNAQDK